MSGILFVEPPSNMQKLQSIKTRHPHLGAPLPFIYITPWLLKASHQVDIIDLRISPLSTLRQYLREKKPIIVGISVMPGNALPRAIRLNSFIKRYSPTAKIVWGGSFPSLHHELCLSIPDVDYVVCGDGEITLTELATALANSATRDDFEKINGLVFRANGSTVSTGPREPVNLDSLPVGGWHLLDQFMPYYLGPQGYLAINTARGCPFKCSFCYNNLLYKGHKRYRVKSIAMVMAEIEYLIRRYKINKLQILDDDFLGHRPRGLELLKTIKKEYPHMRFHIAARIDELTDEETVRMLSALGCESVFLGVESGSPEQLTQMKKGCTTNDALEAAKLCKKYNITATHSFTCGYPDESREQLYASVGMAQMLKEIDPNSQSIIEIISPIPGTPLFNELRERRLLPEMTPAKWCYLTDWKSARQKPWITARGFYEAFQLAFFLAFSSKGHSSGLRSLAQGLGRWSRRRLIDKNPRLLPEYRLLNFLIKKALWGLRG